MKDHEAYVVVVEADIMLLANWKDVVALDVVPSAKRASAAKKCVAIARDRVVQMIQTLCRPYEFPYKGPTPKVKTTLVGNRLKVTCGIPESIANAEVDTVIHLLNAWTYTATDGHLENPRYVHVNGKADDPKDLNEVGDYVGPKNKYFEAAFENASVAFVNKPYWKRTKPEARK